ncbi:MAG: nucleotidyltransferase domain-containing protein [Bacteroidales bacterium]
MQIILDQNKKLVELCGKYNVKQLFAFGSVVKNKLKTDSDLDFLVYFNENLQLLDYADNFFDFMYELEILFNRKIDLISGKAMKNPYFIEEVDKTKQLLYDNQHQKIAV